MGLALQTAQCFLLLVDSISSVKHRMGVWIDVLGQVCLVFSEDDVISKVCLVRGGDWFHERTGDIIEKRWVDYGNPHTDTAESCLMLKSCQSLYLKSGQCGSLWRELSFVSLIYDCWWTLIVTHHWLWYSSLWPPDPTDSLKKRSSSSRTSNLSNHRSILLLGWK